MQSKFLLNAFLVTTVAGLFDASFADEPPNTVKDSPRPRKSPQSLTQQEIDAALTVTGHEVLEQNQQLILYSISSHDSQGSTKNLFHGYGIWGSTFITGPKAKADLLASFYGGLKPKSKGGFKCFEPRHGLRAINDKHTVDVVICFKCGHFRVYLDNNESFFPGKISRTPQPTFDQVLKAAHILPNE